ncbi:MAG TPA: secondary thiamine-phosphate synthase enzyme YjbQ [Dehalococcoidia bacterium]|nr:secondary thiamine-phosphate synthase enzyme YjbQ [Dehalococcoidia bacterium]
MERVLVRTDARESLRDITADVCSAIARTGVQDGLAVLFVPHTTAAITVNENADPDVLADLTGHLRTLAPEDGGFRHAEGNADAHIKASIVGPSESLIIERGRPQLGRWQGIFLCEFDGPRTREVWVQVAATR